MVNVILTIYLILVNVQSLSAIFNMRCIVILAFCTVVTANVDLESVIHNLEETVKQLEKNVNTLATHQLTQDLYQGEIKRAEGHSGIHIVRSHKGGTRPYYVTGHTSGRLAGMHNHGNFLNTIGLGEMNAIMNGVQFRTRHNDYSLKMADSIQDLHATVDIEHPPIPPEVLDQDTVDEQIVEMREWFKAWKNQDYSIRDYRQYFKPILCYLEGAWYLSDASKVDAFSSDRHQIDSPNFAHLQKQYKYTADSGRKDRLENLAFLPRNVYRVVNGTPEYAQWNYRILCQPLKDDLPLNRFRVIDDLATRMRHKEKYSDLSQSQRTRFQLNPDDTNTFDEDKQTTYELLDTLMAQIPGLDNHGSNITDDAFGFVANELNDVEKVLNAAYYHRWFTTSKPGASGFSSRRRGFNDNNLFVSINTQPGVVPTEVETCTGLYNNKICTMVSQRFSYAIPLEVIYMTPLSRWNPYDIEYKGYANTRLGRTVREGKYYFNIFNTFNILNRDVLL